MLKAATAAGLVHFVGAEFRWATGQRLAARVMADGAIGEPRLATFLLHIPGVAAMAVLDAARRSAAGSGREPVLMPQ
jgi:predicted dehydrogenase